MSSGTPQVRGPHPLRERHRAEPLPQPILRDQPSLAERGHAGCGSDRLTQHLLLSGDLAKAEPKALRYRLLHVAARLTHGQRRLWLRIQRTWPWVRDLAAAFARLAALPVPTG